MQQPGNTYLHIHHPRLLKNKERGSQLVLLEQSKRGQAAAAEVAPWGLQPSCPLEQQKEKGLSPCLRCRIPQTDNQADTAEAI